MSDIPEQSEQVRRTLPAHFHTKSRYTDTAGQPWRGRDHVISHFPEDRGEQSDVMRQALATFDATMAASATRQDPTPQARQHIDPDTAARAHALVAHALRGQRVLIPIQATATEEQRTPHGLIADNASDMAMVKLRISSTTMALPLFTSTSHLNAWSPEARPVPMVCEQAAQAAVVEGCTTLIIDPGREPAILLNRSALWAIAQGREWVPPHADALVHAEVASMCETIANIHAADVRAHTSRDIDIVLTLTPGLNRAALDALLHHVHQGVASSQLIAERVSSLKISLRSAPPQPEHAPTQASR